MTSFSISIGTEFSAQQAVLAELHVLADQRDVEFLVVGALARDLMIRGVTGAAPDRLTADIDIIPFDGVEDENRGITWSNAHRMDVLGIREALDAAVVVQMDGFSVKVASLPAQVILKLLAWRDRRLQTTRDAVDLRTIMLAYSDEPYLNAVYQDLDALSEHEFDLELAGADRIGYEAISLMAPAGAAIVRALVDGQCDEDGQLPVQMGSRISRNRAVLGALRQGMSRAR